MRNDSATNSSNTAGLWIYLHFPLLALEMLYPERDPGPSALLDQQQRYLLLCNQTARERGLAPGMAIATAYSLLHEIRLLRRQPEQERQQLESLALWASRFSAQVSLQPDNGVLLEAGSMLHYFQGSKTFSSVLQQQLNQLGFTCYWAAGHTPLAARLLARHPQANGAHDRDSRLAHQDSNRYLALVRALPVTALELEPRVTRQLQGMGLTRIQQLLDLPRNELASRLGPEPLHQLDKLIGAQPDPPRYFTPPLQFNRHLPLLHEVDHTQALLFPLRRLLAELEGYLQSHHRQAQQLTLTLELRRSLFGNDDSAHAREQALVLNHSHGEHRTERWLELWQLRLQRVQLQQPVISLRLCADQFRELSADNRQLFATSQAPQSDPTFINRLLTRLGPDALYRPTLVDDHRPEKSWRPTSVEHHSDQPQSISNHAILRPCWLLKTPQPLANPSSIKRLKGPERIVSGWWDQSPIKRDYYIGRWQDGRLGWLYRDHQGCWFVHGWF